MMDASSINFNKVASPSGKKSRILISRDELDVDAVVEDLDPEGKTVALDEDDVDEDSVEAEDIDDDDDGNEEGIAIAEAEATA